MKILALEFSSDERSVALAEQSHGGIQILASASETGGRSTRAFALIERVLSEAKLEREAIEGLALGIGPGSYTGIRAAISVIQGWQLATNLKSFAVSSVTGLAAQAHARGLLGPVAIVVDAQRGEFYVASYSLSGEGFLETEPLKLVSRAEVQARSDRGELILGPDAGSFAGGQVLVPQAEFIARLAFATAPVPGEELEPIYLRETSFVKAPPPRIIL